MNRSLSEPQVDAALEVLERGLVAIRLAAMAGDAANCEAISDALHNLPTLLKEGDQWGWTMEEFVRLFLDPQRVPDAERWAERLRGVTVGVEPP